MNAIPYDGPEDDWDSYEAEQEVALPGRPRRKVLTWWSAALVALLLGVIGFYVGIRVEKSQVSNSTSTSAFSAVAGTGARAGAAGGTGAGAVSRTGAGPVGRTGAGGGGGGFRAAFGGGAGGSASVGTVSSISGNSLYITETSGNTVKVTLSSATKVAKSVTVGKKAMRPGDLVVVQGAQGASGTLSATSINDTGASPFAAATGGSTSSSAGGSASSAVGSLFGGG
ncbi:MAG: hypothetical protein JO304_13550 [Solirubrobacterales bacterium]|nr:hypothetical protein [Solirubrobacterales bacterium]